MADWSEWEKAVRAAMLADATFAAMLGSDPDGYLGRSFFLRGEPDGGIYPMVTWETLSMGRCNLDRGEGRYRPRIALSVFATNQDIARDIAHYMRSTFRIPSAFSNQIATTGWRVDSLVAGDPMYGGYGRRVNTGENVHEFVTDFELVVTKKD